jgi:hypothetical protein
MGAGQGRGHRADSRHQAPARLDENAVAVQVSLTAREIAAFDDAIGPAAVRGTRYSAGDMAFLNR